MEIKIENRIGERFYLNNGGFADIVEFKNNSNIKIKTNNNFIKTVTMQNLKKGQIKDPFAKTVSGVGFIGVGKHKTMTDKYYAWNRIINRCYSNLDKNYHDVSVCCEWHDFQVFGDWYDENYKIDCVIDKDFKIYKSKIYSPDTCLFIPEEINIAFTQNKKKDRRLPFGVKKNGSGFSSMSFDLKKKTFKTINEAKINHWEFVYTRAKKLIKKYPEYSEYIFDYFVNYKSENENKFEVEIDAYEIDTINDLFYLGMSRNINDPLYYREGKQINLGSGSYKTVYNSDSIDYPECDFDIDTLPYEDESIDVFHCHHVLEHLKNPKFLLKEVERCLKIGGYINITVPYYNSSLYASCADHKTMFNERSWKNMMKQYSYDNGFYNWVLDEHLNIIIGIEEQNLALITQLIKTRGVS